MQPDQDPEYSRLLREKVDQHKAPDELRRKILASLEEERRPAFGVKMRGLLNYLDLHWRALSTAAACGVAATLLVTQLPSLSLADDNVAAQVTASHNRALMASHLIDVVSSDRHTVKPWFAGKIDYSPRVRDYANDGFVLTGGRLDYVNDRVVAALVYKNRLHVIDVYTWPTTESDSGVNKRSRHGINMTEWVDDGMKYYAVSDIEIGELAQLAQLMKAHKGES